MKYTDLERLAKQDRFAWIFKEKYEPEVLAFLSELCCHSHTTGILIEREDALQTPKVFYHATLQRNVQGILDQGFILNNFMPDPSSFGQDVVYTFADISRLAGAEAIVAVTYQGPYLEAIAEWDKDDSAQHSCMLYPEYIQSIASMNGLPKSKPQRTNAFTKTAAPSETNTGSGTNTPSKGHEH